MSISTFKKKRGDFILFITYRPEVISNKHVKKGDLKEPLGRNTYEIYPKPVTTKRALNTTTKPYF